MKKIGKYHILTFGCQMNKNDSERLAGVLEGLGLKETQNQEEALVLFINTCSVRQHAEDRVYGLVRNWKKLKAKNPNLIIGITGCLPGRDKDGKLKKKLGGADLFFPIADLALLPDFLRDLNPSLFKQDFEALEEYWDFVPKRKEKYRAFVTIQNGCNNFCTYCVVPNSRGREKNRPLTEILQEVRDLVKHDCQEITLLGQVVNNYKIVDKNKVSKKNIFKGKDDFAALLWELNQIKGLTRINWTAADPQYFNNYQIKALTLPNQVNYLHLPVQSGDNQVLKRMNRKYSREYYLDLIKKIRKACPGIAIGTDIIVGFCGETKEQFKNTIELYKQSDFDISYHAVYSERSGTLAANKFTDDISLEEKKRRWREVQDLMLETVLKKNQQYLEKNVSVLVDNFSDGWCSGNSLEMKMVKFKGKKQLMGKIIKVQVYKAQEWILWGRII